eukprot:jgi/Botrbrau1/10056/Bobra.0355s0012.1
MSLTLHVRHLCADIRTGLHGPDNCSRLADDLLLLKRLGFDGISLDARWEDPQSASKSYLICMRAAQNAGLTVQLNLNFSGLPPGLCPGLSHEHKMEMLLQGQHGNFNMECLSFELDNRPIPGDGRTGMMHITKAAQDIVQSILAEDRELWGTVLTDICLPMGPEGIWAYPFSPLIFDQEWHMSLFFKMLGAPNYWVSAPVDNDEPASVKSMGASQSSGPHSRERVGEFMCFDKLMLERFKAWVSEAGHPEWFLLPHLLKFGSVPIDCSRHPRASKEYFAIFHGFYTGTLIQHGNNVLDNVLPIIEQANKTVDREVMPLVRMANPYWSGNERASRAAAGYVSDNKDWGFREHLNLLKERGVGLIFPGMEVLSPPTSPFDAEVFERGRSAETFGNVKKKCEEMGLRLVGENSCHGALRHVYSLNQMTNNASGCSRAILQRFEGVHDFLKVLKEEEDLQIFLRRFCDAKEYGDPEYFEEDDEMSNPVWRDYLRRKKAGLSVEAQDPPEAEFPEIAMPPSVFKGVALRAGLLLFCILTAVFLSNRVQVF